MAILKSAIINIRQSVKHHDNNKHNYVWTTYKQGDVIAEGLVESIKAVGGEFVEEVNVVKKVVPVKKVLKKQVKSKSSKKRK